MYNYVTIVDGHSLFLEIDQQYEISNVQVVVANKPKVERMVLMINKHPVVFFTH